MRAKLIAVALLCLAISTTVALAQKPGNSKTSKEIMTAKKVVEAYSIALSNGDIPTAFSHFSPNANGINPATINIHV